VVHAVAFLLKEVKNETIEEAIRDIENVQFNKVTVKIHPILYNEDEVEVEDRCDTTGMNVVWMILIRMFVIGGVGQAA